MKTRRRQIAGQSQAAKRSPPDAWAARQATQDAAAAAAGSSLIFQEFVD
jgi:hypothetical protein